MQGKLDTFEQAIKDEGAKTYLTKIFLFIVVYVITAKLGLELAFDIEQVTTIWPPTGLAITALLIWGYHYFPGVFIGALIANVLTNTPPLVATGIATGNTLEAVAAVLLINRFIPGRQILEKISGVLLFVVLAAFLCTTISATIGVASLRLGGLISGEEITGAWITWWVGNMLGTLIIVPLILAWRNIKYRTHIANNLFEAVFVLMLIATVCLIIFSQNSSKSALTSELNYLLFPFVIWASLRLVQIGAIMATSIITVAAVWATLVGTGPYARSNSVEENLIYLHTFILVLTVTGLVLAVAVAGRLRSEEALTEKARELEKAKKEVLHNIQWRKDIQLEMRDATGKINEILSGIVDDKTKDPKR